LVRKEPVFAIVWFDNFHDSSIAKEKSSDRLEEEPKAQSQEPIAQNLQPRAKSYPPVPAALAFPATAFSAFSNCS
jgi:hypothetical protein